MIRMAIACLMILGTGLASSEAATMRVKNLKVLVPIYRGAPGDDARLSDHEVLMAKNGLEVGRLFYFRNSLARLNIEFDWLVIEQTAPETAGPTMDNIIADLHERGIKDGDYDGLIATGVGLKGNWGGFNVLGGAGGCFGIGSVRGVGYPAYDPDTGYGWAWIFAHEFQHALDLVIVESSKLDMLHSHPYVDRVEEFFRGYYQGGEHWDWIAVTLREFDDYLRIEGVRNDFLECTDADNDGLPDDDPRLPMDERRFGSDPSLKDTDGDGLGDLAEFTADRYFGSDPTKRDTDDDGLDDDEDPYPVIAIRPTLAYGDSPKDVALLLDSVAARNDDGGPIAVAGCWTEQGLHLQFSGPRAFKALVKIDGTPANGFWEGGDSYVLRIADGVVEFAGLGLRGAVADATAEADTNGSNEHAYVLNAFIPAALGQGVSKEINYGGNREPQDVVDGLTLVAGRSIGFNFMYRFDSGTEAVLTPHHTMYATRLTKPDNAPDFPVLRAPEETSAAAPVVEVLGVASDSPVKVQCARGTWRKSFRRIGPGDVLLTDLPQDGTYTLTVAARGSVAATGQITLDRAADAPTFHVTRDGDGQAIVEGTCEPGAMFELWWGMNSPLERLAGGQADENGNVRVVIGDETLTGWVVAGYRGSQFDELVYIDAWPTIDRFFKGGAPDPRLPTDAFSYRCTGLLQIDAAGYYTFELETDDGSRFYINDEIVLDHWGHHGMTPKRATTYLAAGTHRARIDYYEEDGWAGFKFRGGAAGDELTYHLPVRRTPLKLDEIDLFGVQVDPLGNRSGFGRASGR